MRDEVIPLFTARQMRAAVRIGVVALLVGLAAAFSSCGDAGGDDSASGNTLTRGEEEGTLRLAFVINRPLAYIDQDGELQGSGVAVASTILKRLGIPKFEPILTGFDGLVPGLNAGRWDMSAFPFFITPERCAEAAFTNPMAQYREGALVKEGNPKDIRGYADIAERSDITLAIQAGTAELEYAKEVGIDSSQISTYPEELLGIQAVQAGRADAFMNATFVLAQAQKNYDTSGLEVADPFTGPIIDGEEVIAYGGWALRPEDAELRKAFNAELAKMLKSGELLKIQSKWGYTKDDMPTADLTAEDLCPDAPWSGND